MLSTVAHSYDYVVFAIPPGKPYSSFEKLFFPFKLTVWLCICASFLSMMIAIVILNLISKKKRDFVIGQHNDAPFLNLFATCLGAGMTDYHLPRRNFGRSILGIVLLTTLILQNAYLGNLVSFLQTQMRMEPLYSVQDVYDSDFTISIGSSRTYDYDSPNIQHR